MSRLITHEPLRALEPPEIAYGFLLGSLYLLTYAMARGIDTGGSAVAFTTDRAALVIVLYLGHRSLNGQFPDRRAVLGFADKVETYKVTDHKLREFIF
ncbi:hypothetical protein ACX80Z_15830 [Arthrobacter sp. TMT4-20]